MRKRLFALAIIAICTIFVIPEVKAAELYYKNDNGVILTKDEYDFFSYMFWEGSQELITKEDYSRFVKSNIMYGELGDSIYTEMQTRATSIETNNRTLKIVKSCNSDCLISVTLTWKNNPTIKSYDVMGAYLENTQLVNSPKTVIGSTSYTDIKTFNNGFGVSMLLPKYDAAPVINQTFRVAKGGTIYASYQHSMRNISLADSKNYTLSKTGYGGVFNFYSTAANTYDRMNGVSINL
jgi:hypothetical protein